MGPPGRPIPVGKHTIAPYMIVKGAADAIEFHKKAFGAEEIVRMPSADGKSIMHAEIKIGDSSVYLTDVDTFFKRAINAGATETMKSAQEYFAQMASK